MKIRVRVAGHERLGRLASRLRTAAEELPRDLQTELVGAAPPVLAKQKAAVLAAAFPAAEPSRNHRPRTTGLRTRLAAATSTRPLSSPPGVRFEVDGGAVLPANPRGGHQLAKYTDTELARRWRHQTFGRTGPDDWFVQRGQPWFFEPIRANEIRFSAGVERVVARTARKIEGS